MVKIKKELNYVDEVWKEEEKKLKYLEENKIMVEGKILNRSIKNRILTARAKELSKKLIVNIDKNNRVYKKDIKKIASEFYCNKCKNNIIWYYKGGNEYEGFCKCPEVVRRNKNHNLSDFF